MWISGAGRFEYIEAARARRHHQIGEDDIELLPGVEKSDRFDAISCRGKTEATRLHVLTECQSEVTVVVDNEESGFSWDEVRYLDHGVVIGKSIENFRMSFYT